MLNILSKKTIFFIFILLVIIYGIFQSKNFRQGPVIFLNNPEYISTIEDSYTLKFPTENVDDIYINGRKVFLDTEGKVEDKLVLFEGINEVKILYYDKYKKEGSKRIVIYKK